jgi:5-hydroxyisourate hydrolase
MKSPITTHILDISKGKPAEGVAVILEIQDESGKWLEIVRGKTNSDGRISDLLPETFILKKNFYRLTFETMAYFQSNGTKSFYPYIQITFEIQDITSHYHVPLLLSPFGYSTYRGS